MFSFSAVGDISPPVIIYPYKRLPANIVNSAPKKYGIGTSDTGWMKEATFYKYIGNVFDKDLVERGVQFPIIYSN